MNNATLGTLGFHNFDYYEDKDDISNHEANVQNVQKALYIIVHIQVKKFVYIFVFI